MRSLIFLMRRDGDLSGDPFAQNFRFISQVNAALPGLGSSLKLCAMGFSRRSQFRAFVECTGSWPPTKSIRTVISIPHLPVNPAMPSTTRASIFVTIAWPSGAAVRNTTTLSLANGSVTSQIARTQAET